MTQTESEAKQSLLKECLAECLAPPEAPWAKVSESVKCERLRGRVKSLDWRLQILQEQVEALMRHQHGLDGGLLTVLEQNPCGVTLRNLRELDENAPF